MFYYICFLDELCGILVNKLVRILSRGSKLRNLFDIMLKF